MSANRQQRERDGRRGETLACWYLRLKGWRIVARRQRVAGGEVDIVARRGATLAFVEVKWRRDAAALAHAVDLPRLGRVARAAEQLGARYAKAQDSQRIDVILLAPRRWPQHLQNVWVR